MPIGINGTIVTNNRINGTSISSETVNGTQVHGGTSSQVWVLAYQTSSEPVVDLGILESSSDTSYWLMEITLDWPPNNYTVGTTAAVWDGDTTYYTYQVQEG